MKKRSKRSTVTIMRALHRDVGALVVGLTLVFCISGLTLIYRDAGFLMFEQEVVKQLEPNLNPSEVKSSVRLRRFRVQETNDTHIVFNNGLYEKETGIVSYTVKKYPEIIGKLTAFHKVDSGKLIHWVSLTYGVLLLFLAVSSIWMYQPGTTVFKRFLSFAGIGLALAILLISFS